ncbi:MAG: 30S ribosomal protein S6 [Candidatus Yonathbacteria bacterium]|nr:30S ribosomal protein S6 [Candidatus Yonathbacteria bacterium]
MNHQEHTEPRIYELGYHLVPTLAMEQIPQASGAVRGMIERISKDIIAEELPVFIDLAYQIVKTVDHKNKRFNEAYFGWVKFEANPEGIATLEEEIKKDENVLRYIVLKTIRENTFIAKKFASAKVKEVEEAVAAESADRSPELCLDTRPGREQVEVSDEVAKAVAPDELDKAIEELVA